MQTLTIIALTITVIGQGDEFDIYWCIVKQQVYECLYKLIN